MYTLEELKQKLKEDYNGFELSQSIEMDGEYVSSFSIKRFVGEDLILFCYFWDIDCKSYISYFV